MNLRAIHGDEFETVAGWLQDEENSRWLDFGGGRRSVDAMGLKIMSQRSLHCLRVYGPSDAPTPVGVVGLSNVDREFGTGEVWFVLGEQEYRRRNLTVRAVSAMLDHGFRVMGLQSVFAWTVEANRGGRRVLERLNFTQVGRRRRCHRVKGQLYDRLHFDLLAEEFRSYPEPTKGSGGIATAALTKEER